MAPRGGCCPSWPENVPPFVRRRAVRRRCCASDPWRAPSSIRSNLVFRRDRVGMPPRDFTNEDLFSSPMMSMHNSTHSSQMNTVGPAMSLRTSCWLLPQNMQWSGFLVSPLLTLFISEPRQDTSHHSRNPQAKPGSHTIEKVNYAPARKVAAPPPHQLSRKLLRILDRLGCLSLRSALASIWRMRSRVTENCWPTSSSV